MATASSPSLHQSIRATRVPASELSLTLFSIGGEEFALLLSECDATAASTFAERLREAVASAVFTPGGEPQRITISIGIAELSPGRDTRAALMAAADAALYRAKSLGRNRVCVEMVSGTI